MVMKTSAATLDEIEEPLREHYKEVEDPKTKAKSYVLDIEGPIDPLPQVKSLRQENGAYRIKLREAEAKYGKFEAFKDMDPTEVLATLDRVKELEIAAGGKLDDAAIDKIVEGRMKSKTAPLERQIATLTGERDLLKTTVGDYTAKEKKRIIVDDVRAAALKVKLLPDAVEDAVMYAERVMEVSEEGVVSVKDNVGFTPGLDSASWLADMQAKRPHWWGPSQGGGGRGGSGGGGGGVNPWTAENWNMTEQGKIHNADPKRAAALAANAGTSIGGKKPALKK